MYKIIALSVLLFFSLQVQASGIANEFPYIQPISVEIAPNIAPETVKKEDQQAEKKAKIAKVRIQKEQQKQKKEKASHAKYKLLIQFPHNIATLQEDARKQIKALAKYLKKHNDVQAIIYGYADENETKVLELAQKRAKTVVKLLHKYGIKSTRLTAIGTNMQKADSFPVKNDNSQIQLLLIN